MLCTYHTYIICSYLLGSLFSNNIVVQVKSSFSMLRNVIHIVLRCGMGVLIFTNHLTRETCETETKSQLQSLLLSCFLCRKFCLESFFLADEFSWREWTLSTIFIISVHVLGHTVLFCWTIHKWREVNWMEAIITTQIMCSKGIHGWISIDTLDWPSIKTRLTSWSTFDQNLDLGSGWGCWSTLDHGCL